MSEFYNYVASQDLHRPFFSSIPISTLFSQLNLITLVKRLTLVESACHVPFHYESKCMGMSIMQCSLQSRRGQENLLQVLFYVLI